MRSNDLDALQIAEIVERTIMPLKERISRLERVLGPRDAMNDWAHRKAHDQDRCLNCGIFGQAWAKAQQRDELFLCPARREEA